MHPWGTPIHAYAKLKVKFGSDARNGNGHPFMDPNQSSALVKVKEQRTRQIFLLASAPGQKDISPVMGIPPVMDVFVLPGMHSISLPMAKAKR